jgi:Carbamoyl-phosphate synthase L chain, ATP binding domain
MPSNIRVLLTNTNRWPITARLAIELAKVGCEVSVLCPVPGHPAHKTRAVRQIYRYSSSRPIASLLTAIESSQPDIIVPCDDLGVQHLHQLYVKAKKKGAANIAALVESSLGPHDSFAIVSSRYKLLRMAAENGVLTPRTRIIRDIEDLRCNSTISTFPCVLKADGTWGGSGVRIAYDREEAEKVFWELGQRRGAFSTLKQLVTDRGRSSTFFSWRRRPKLSLVAQSYIQGRPANCAVVCWKGRVLARIGVDVISSQGVKGPAIVVRPIESCEMMQAADIIASRLHLTGFFGLDFMIESGTNLIYLIEMNPRCTPLCHLQLGQGKDLVGALTAELQGRSCRTLPPLTTSNTIAYFPQAQNCQSRFLRSSFNDVPVGEPELVEDLLNPWSDRGLVGRLLDRIRQSVQDESQIEEYVYMEAIKASAVELTPSLKSVHDKTPVTDPVASGL